MRTIISRPLRAVGATIASFGLILGLGACSSDADVEKFCEQAKEIEEAEAPEGPEDITAMAEKINGISAPDDIKDDWTVLQESYSDLADIVGDLDQDDMEAAVAAQEEIVEKIDNEKITAAGDNVDKFTQENCEN